MSNDTVAMMVTKMVMKIDLLPQHAFFPFYTPKRCAGPSKRKLLKKGANQDKYSKYFRFSVISGIFSALTIDNLYLYLYNSRDTGNKVDMCIFRSTRPMK